MTDHIIVCEPMHSPESLHIDISCSGYVGILSQPCIQTFIVQLSAGREMAAGMATLPGKFSTPAGFVESLSVRLGFSDPRLYSTTPRNGNRHF